MQKWLPADLWLIISVAVIVFGHELIPSFDIGLLRIVLGGVLALFAPGYALVSLLIPEGTRTDQPPKRTGTVESSENRLKPLVVTFPERALLGAGVSLVLVPLIGVVLYHSPWGLGEAAFISGMAVLSLVFSLGAVVRRSRLPPEERFQITIRGAPKRIQAWYGGSKTVRERNLNVILLIGLLLAVAGVGTAIAFSDGGEQYTEFYLLSEDPETGDMIADEYPTDVQVGEESEFVVGITNQESHIETYTLIVQVEHVENGTEETIERREVDRFERSVSPNETVEIPVTVEHQVSRENLRLSYLLYVNSPPPQPSVENAYRELHLWIDVADEDSN